MDEKGPRLLHNVLRRRTQDAGPVTRTRAAAKAEGGSKKDS